MTRLNNPRVYAHGGNFQLRYHGSSDPEGLKDDPSEKNAQSVSPVTGPFAFCQAAATYLQCGVLRCRASPISLRGFSTGFGRLGKNLIPFMDSSDALVLRTVDFSESSLVVTLLTRNFGKISGLAKGARRLKNPFETSLDLGARIRVGFLRKRGDALDLLTEAKLVRRFRPVPGNEAGLYATYYWLELLDRLTEGYDAQPALFDLAVASVLRFEVGTHIVRTLLRAEWLLLLRIGQQPSFDRCVECGKPVTITATTNRGGRIAFGLLDGGVLCSGCREGHTSLLRITVAAIEALGVLARPARSGPTRTPGVSRTGGQAEWLHGRRRASSENAPTRPE